MNDHDYRIELPYTPPSLNAMGSRGNWRVYHKAKTNLQVDLEALLLVARLPRGLFRVEASCEMTFKTRRRRDTGNFRWLIEKSLGDALVRGGFLPDDASRHYSFNACVLNDEPGIDSTVIHLDVFPQV